MAGFRKKSFPILLYPPKPVIEIQPQTFEEDHDGNTVQRVAYVPVNLSSKEAASTIPTYKEYYLDELLKAGVPLDQINVSGYFNPTDSVSINSARAAAVSRLASKVEDIQANKSVEPINE